jgi:hypothetical protein
LIFQKIKNADKGVFNLTGGENEVKMKLTNFAGMAELVDAQDLKSCNRKVMRVRFPLPALINFFNHDILKAISAGIV